MNGLSAQLWAQRGLGSIPGESRLRASASLSLSLFLRLTPAHDSRPRAAGTPVIANSRRPH